MSSTGQRSSDGSATTVGTYWAKARQVTGDQDQIVGLNTVEDIWEFKIRGEPVALKVKDIITWDDNDYQVMGISDQSIQKRFITIKASYIRPDV